MSKRLKIIFTLSILLNVLFLGASAGVAFKIKDRVHRHTENIREELSVEGRDIVRNHMREGIKGGFGHIKDIRGQQKILEDVLKAETFDRAAYMQAAKNLMQAKSGSESARIERTADLMEKLSTDDRQKMAVHLARRMAGERPLKKGKDMHRGLHDRAEKIQSGGADETQDAPTAMDPK